MSNRNKQMQEYKAPPSLDVHRNPIIYVPHEVKEENTKPKVALPLLSLCIAAALFLLAYAGPDIGNVLAYLVIPALSFFPGLMVGERFGKVAGVLAGLLIVAVLTPVYGTSVIASSISLFTSLQKISQGILAMFSVGAVLVGLILYFLKPRNED